MIQQSAIRSREGATLQVSRVSQCRSVLISALWAVLATGFHSQLTTNYHRYLLAANCQLLVVRCWLLIAGETLIKSTATPSAAKAAFIGLTWRHG